MGAVTELTPEEIERLRKRDSLPILSETYGQVAKIIGDEKAELFARHFGGREARITIRNSRMLALLGRAALDKLRNHFGAEEVRWPACSNYFAMVDARMLRRLGYSIPEISRRVYRDDNTVKRYVAGIACGSDPDAA